jgi:hypothetical protein
MKSKSLKFQSRNYILDQQGRPGIILQFSSIFLVDQNTINSLLSYVLKTIS